MVTSEGVIGNRSFSLEVKMRENFAIGGSAMNVLWELQVFAVDCGGLSVEIYFLPP
ncbi:hypothetical protein L195_g033830 [Trifolium pratense]|uniref:Uncharacterized protein n=1 Tax=Trifolium pratense TaxID=57577 RepID=A0A2K3LH48_TRIPR|nr:hypothetical protein L195_g033830 [Trifolium pratense]